jgi:hypothetical protein
VLRAGSAESAGEHCISRQKGTWLAAEKRVHIKKGQEAQKPCPAAKTCCCSSRAMQEMQLQVREEQSVCDTRRQHRSCMPCQTAEHTTRVPQGRQQAQQAGG